MYLTSVLQSFCYSVDGATRERLECVRQGYKEDVLCEVLRQGIITFDTLSQKDNLNYATVLS